jgi:ribose transport system substrate-binding protein
MPRCSAPGGLQKVLGFAQDNQRLFMQGVARGLAAAAKDRQLEYRVALADNDPAKMIEQVRAFPSRMSALSLPHPSIRRPLHRTCNI